MSPKEFSLARKKRQSHSARRRTAHANNHIVIATIDLVGHDDVEEITKEQFVHSTANRTVGYNDDVTETTKADKSERINALPARQALEIREQVNHGPQATTRRVPSSSRDKTLPRPRHSLVSCTNPIAASGPADQGAAMGINDTVDERRTKIVKLKVRQPSSTTNTPITKRKATTTTHPDDEDEYQDSIAISEPTSPVKAVLTKRHKR